MIFIASASHFSIEQLHQVASQAFSDYVVQMHLSQNGLEKLLATRGFDRDLSVVATENGQLLGYWFVGKQSAYPSQIYVAMTGTIPEARGRGIATKLFNVLQNNAMQANYESIRLEVITTNTPAVKAYEKLGFVAHRNFQCFSLKKEAFKPSDTQVEPVASTLSEIRQYGSSLWEREPSWQNTAYAIDALGEEVSIYACKKAGELAAYIALVRKTGSVMQLAVAPKMRRKGYASALLSTAFKVSEKGSLTFVNVDESDETVMQTLIRLGAEKTLQQYEMFRPLSVLPDLSRQDALSTS